MYSYTVRSLEERVYAPNGASFELKHGGACLTIRREGKVVKQFARLSSEAKAHRAARLWFTMRGIVLRGIV